MSKGTLISKGQLFILLVLTVAFTLVISNLCGKHQYYVEYTASTSDSIFICNGDTLVHASSPCDAMEIVDEIFPDTTVIIDAMVTQIK